MRAGGRTPAQSLVWKIVVPLGAPGIASAQCGGPVRTVVPSDVGGASPRTALKMPPSPLSGEPTKKDEPPLHLGAEKNVNLPSALGTAVVLSATSSGANDGGAGAA